jgi:type I restriction enzyme, S subunit
LERLLNHAWGAAQENLSPKALRDLEIPLPPIDEQRRIADILDRADAIRRKRQEAIRLTEELLRSAFLEVFGNPITNPKGWQTQQLKSLVNSSRGISYGIVQRGPEVPGGVPVIRISNIGSNKFIDDSIVRTAPEIAAQYQRTFLKGGELLISIRGTVGRVAIAPPETKGWNVSREIAVVPLEADLSAHYLHHLLLSNGAQNYITDEVRGVAQRGINLRELSLLPVPIPTKKTQEQWDQLISKMYRSIDHIEKQFDESDTLFNSILQKAFQGEL